MDLLFHTPDEKSDLPTPLRPAVWEYIASEKGGDDVEEVDGFDDDGETEDDGSDVLDLDA